MTDEGVQTENGKVAVAGLLTTNEISSDPSREASTTTFFLLTNEEEEQLIGDVQPLANQNEYRTAAGNSCKKNTSLRSISLPKPSGPSHASTSPVLKAANSVENCSNGPCGVPVATLPEAKKSTKEVNEYYKKQNELLENFKNDSEQIQVFQKTRTRQRLQSTNSMAADEKGSQVASVANDREVKAPLLRNVYGDDDVSVRSSAPSIGDSTKNGNGVIEGKLEKGTPRHDSNEAMMAKHEAAQEKARKASKAAGTLAKITLLVNISLMLAKAVASYLSGSLSIISSLVDSCVDITSGLVISLSSRMIKKRDPYLYPRGRTRLEPLSLIIISVVMGVASVQLIFDAFKRIFAAYHFETTGEGELPELDMSWTTVGIMISTIIVKFTLFLVCQKYKTDPSIEVLAMDHRNDCVSNSVALACAWLAKKYWYYLDPIGALLVSVYILFTWVRTGKEHLSKLSGKSAEPEFINRIIKVCIDHDPRISHLDTVYVYHFGTKFLVEVHIVLDRNMILKVAHDISESLQINIESLPEVERAFVHTDYEYEHQPHDEHKVV